MHRLLDLFCGAGGCAAGYVRAGLEVTGVDIELQPRYLLSGASAFVQADALEYLAAHGHEFDVIHASPPCQAYCKVNQQGRAIGKSYPDLVGTVRHLLQGMRTGRPYVIENVIGAPLQGAVMVCGSAFGLAVRRHRLFESNLLLFGTCCRHHEQQGSYPTCYRPKTGERRTAKVVQVYGHTAGKALWPAAMGIDWMTSRELTQAIPPAYTHFIGRQVLRAVAG